MFILRNSRVCPPLDGRRILSNGVGALRCSSSDSSDLVRINKLMAHRGIAGRRQADELVKEGLVLVDGATAVIGQRISPSADIELVPRGKRLIDRKLTFVVNKPVSFHSPTTSTKPRGTRFAQQLLTLDNQSERCPYKGRDPASLRGLSAAGRLDADSEGLMVFTQDGLVARRLLHREEGLPAIEKEYLVTVQSSEIDLGDKFARAVALDVMRSAKLDDRELLPMEIEWVREERVSVNPALGGQLRFVLTEGRYRQVRRVCQAAGLRVSRLVRVRIGGLNLMGLKTGYWRLVKHQHLDLLLSSQTSKHGEKLNS